jgi:uncharacterized paraquat-inducible protein A
MYKCIKTMVNTQTCPHCNQIVPTQLKRNCPQCHKALKKRKLTWKEIENYLALLVIGSLLFGGCNMAIGHLKNVDAAEKAAKLQQEQQQVYNAQWQANQDRKALLEIVKSIVEASRANQ